MAFTENQWRVMAERFNKLGLKGKLLLIKQHIDIFYLESDGYNFFLRLKDEGAMENGYDTLFEFPNILSYKDMVDIFSLIDINLNKL